MYVCSKHIILALYLQCIIYYCDGMGPWPCDLCGGNDGYIHCDKVLKEHKYSRDGSYDNWKTQSFLSAAIKLSRTPTHAGMHSKISSRVHFSPDVNTELDSTNECKVLSVQQVPNSFFIDQYEIRRDYSKSNFRIHFDENIDVEKPQYLATNATVPIYTSIGADKKGIWSETIITWHSRYHEISRLGDRNLTHTHANIPLPKLSISCAYQIELEMFRTLPYYSNMKEKLCNGFKGSRLLAHCSGGEFDKESKSICVWTEVPSSGNEINVPIPIGQSTDGPWVMTITILVTALSTLTTGLFAYRYRI